MPSPITIAHLSDVHLSPLQGFWPPHWNIKRLLGFANWVMDRRHIYLRSVLDRLVADLRLQNVDHVAVTGDLVNIGLPHELENALRWLESIGPPTVVSVIPGNHDIYTRRWRDAGVARWQLYMTSDALSADLTAKIGVPFPYVRRIREVALIGLNSAVPTPPGVAAGHLGRKQLEALGELLQRLGELGLFRLVLIHHPPLPGQAKPLRALRDAADLERTLLRHGAELVLHGHNHYDMLAWLTVTTGSFPIVGIGSSSAYRTRRKETLARYNVYRIHPDSNHKRIELISRGLLEPDGPVVELERRWLEPGAIEAIGA
jgi:3',5'-cyclic AMP phosphodiesterase CpdA